MKRWQHRGVVEDSEDDEISLGAASPSPEPPRKRAKHDEDHVATSQQQQQQQHDALQRSPANQVATLPQVEDSPWIEPKTAITYGQKTKAKPQKRLRTPPPPTLEDKHASPRVMISIESASASAEQPPATQRFVFAQTGSTPESDSDSLPELRPILRRPAIDARKRPSSTDSSPLSERDVSPPAVFPPAERPSRPERPESERILDNPMVNIGSNGVDIESNGSESRAPTSTAVAKRSFRARKANQLNPYQYERALYLQQCKARGVQPIRLVEQPNDEEEGQIQSQDDATQSEDAPYLSSSPADAPRAGVRARFDIPPSDGERETTSGHRLPKRRRLENRDRAPGPIPSTGTTHRQREEFPVPPSPPRTGSDLSAVEEAPSGFRMPPRMTPAPLPTPQISSDLKRTEAHNESTPDSSPNRSRASTVNRSRRRVSVVSVSSDSEPESDYEAKRLRREQKRIRGVLPASWLKIDFRAQKPREVPVASTRQRSPSTSPQRQRPQKGVAQRIVRRGIQTADSPLPLLSGEESGSDSSIRSFAQLKQRKLDAASRQLAFARQNAFDDDVMENDFIDPMLAGPSRSRGIKKSRGHQPRITQAFKTSAISRTEYSEERVSSKDAPTTSRRRRGPRKTTRRRIVASGPPPVRLSIADAVDDSVPGQGQPAFVKLALRQARRHQDQGRHSPTHKLLRLATADDTEDASSTLRAWRERSIVPRVNRRRRTDLAESGYEPHQGPAVRAALAEISSNQTYTDPADEGTHHPEPKENPRVNQAGQAMPYPHARSLAQLEGELAPKSTSKRRLRLTKRPLRLRDAQLETLEGSFEQNNRSALFERRMQCLTEHVARQSRQHGEADFQLDRYLCVDGAPLDPVNARTKQTRNPSGSDAGTYDPLAVTIPYRPRKRRARRLNVEAREYRQPSEPLPDTAITIVDDVESHETPKPVLQDLGSFGTRYPVTFDIRPVAVGAFFDQITFIGSSELHEALNLCKHNLDRQRGCMRVHLKSEILNWGVWQDEVAVHLSEIATATENCLGELENDSTRDNDETSSHQPNDVISYLLRSVVRYFAQCISFSDPIDRLACVERLHQLVTILSETLAEHRPTVHMRTAVTRVLQYSTVLANQGLQLCDHSTVPVTTKMKARKLLLKVAERLATHAIKAKSDELRTAYEDSLKRQTQEVGFKDDVPALSSMIILENALRDTHGSTQDFWTVLQPALTLENPATCSIKCLEKAWYEFFTILPALTFDAHGVARDACLSTDSTGAWNVPQLLLKRTFDLYEASSDVRCASVNDYVRALLSRCHYLVNSWRCFQSDLALSTIYDFFAKRNLHLLNSEESRGSPSFLQDTSAEGFLQIQPDDRSFHIFLKLLSVSLKGMQAHGVPLRKIQSIVFRLTPNHARTYRKDATLVKADLEALRNHYDLLCTLYCAAPAGSRPNVYLLQNLIDHSTSHREACRLSVRAWAHVAVFQAAREESADCLRTLIDWYSDMVKTTVTQYRLAKSEAERDFEVAQSEAYDAGSDTPVSVLESTIANNQSQIAATLVDALAGLKRALQSTRNTKTAKALVEGTGFLSILELFDPSQRRLLSTMIEALAVIDAAVDVESRPMSSIDQQGHSEDSQEFGDLDALQAFAEDDSAMSHNDVPFAGFLLGAVGHFRSNVFGADVAADDSLLVATVDTWTRLARSASRPHDKSWHSYIDEYSPTSWNQLRDTSQKRKYTPYFLSRLVEQSDGSEDIKQAVLSTRLLSLVDREAVLKFQHLLTSTVLNNWSDEPLLINLPFAWDPTSGKYHITLTQLRERRAALMSSVLCNMRDHYDRMVRLNRARSSELRSIYGDMLRQMMNAMKSHYQELQTSASADIADAGSTGAYVAFVQQIVSSLQRYTAGGICPVDRFFLDSSAFPLPAGDPTYVVGRLRSYARKLQEGKSRAQLAVFIQTVIERALIDGQQDYLVDQMSTAMMDVDMLTISTPTLWQVMSQSILPVYISHSLDTPNSWIAAIPVLQACMKTAPSLLYNFDLSDSAAVEVAISTLGSVLHSISQQVTTALVQPSLLDLAHALKVLGAMLMVGQASTSLVAFLARSATANQELSAHLGVLRSQAVALRERLVSAEQDFPVDLPIEASPPDFVWQDTRTFTEKQLRETIETSWYSDNGRHFVRRGNASKELVVQLESAVVEREQVLQVITNFCKTFDATVDYRVRERQARKACDDILGGLDV